MPAYARPLASSHDKDATLDRLGLLDLRPVYQPVVDLRDGRVVGYEALTRGGPASRAESPAQLFAAARAEDVVAQFDAACREAALRGFDDAVGAGAFALFLNADAEHLGEEGRPALASRQTLIVEVTERALVSRPAALLQALTRFREQGWGVALDDVGADSRSLALMSLLYPDVIKLDLRLLRDRSGPDVARIVTAVGADAERRQALVLAEGIDSPEQLAVAQGFGAVLGQGFLLGEPGPLPEALPEPGRRLRLTAAGGDPSGHSPFERVTNWRRPARGSRELAERAAAIVARQGLALGEIAVVLAAYPDEGHASADELALLRELAAGVAFVGALCAPAELGEAGVRTGSVDRGDVLRGSWTVAALGPNFAACFVAREAEEDVYEFATSYDRDLVVESAIGIMARLRPLPQPALR